MIRYKIEEFCGDWAIYEVRPDAEGEYTESETVLILNSRANAEYIKAILEHEARYPNAAVPYRPEVAKMSDEEVVAIFRVCSSGMSEGCERCPLRDAEECFGKIDERILGMAARYVEAARSPSPADGGSSIPEGASGADADDTNVGCKREWISVDERLPDGYEDYLVVVKHKYEYEDEWEYDVDVGGPALDDDGYIDHFWKIYHDWEVGAECHITHWMPLPEPPMVKGGAE
jgi:hypothetical protein